MARARKSEEWEDDYVDEEGFEDAEVVVQQTATEGKEISFIPILQLVEAGVAAGDVKRLQDGGINSVQALCMRTSRELGEIKGLSEAKAARAIASARTLLYGEGNVLKTGKDVLKDRERIIHISWGSESVNGILGGGIETGSLTELFGEFRTGKTQICHHLTVECFEHGWSSVYIDCEGTFRPDRISQMAEARGASPDAVLASIIYARAYTTEQQIELLALVSKKIAESAEGGCPVRLVVVDSVSALFRSEYTGRGQLSERQQVLGKYLSQLTKLSEEFNVAVVLTNQVCADPGGGLSFAGAATNKPIGGNILAHASTTRVSLRKGKGGNRVAKIFDSPNMPEAEGTYTITAEGISEGD